MYRSSKLFAALVLSAICGAAMATPPVVGGGGNSGGGSGNNNTGGVGVGVGIGVGGNSNATGGNANAQGGKGGKANAVANSTQRQTTRVRTGDTNIVLQNPNGTTPAATPAPQFLSAEDQLGKAALELAAAQAYARGNERPVSSAYAPNMSPTSPCALTVSGGIQAKNLGFSIGGTPIAEFCKKMEIARAAWNMDDKDTALEVMCSDPDYRAARKRAKKVQTQWCAEDQAAPAVAANDSQVRSMQSASAPNNLQLLP